MRHCVEPWVYPYILVSTALHVLPQKTGPWDSGPWLCQQDAAALALEEEVLGGSIEVPQEIMRTRQQKEP